jgi:hypothetical protein
MLDVCDSTENSSDGVLPRISRPILRRNILEVIKKFRLKRDC